MSLRRNTENIFNTLQRPVCIIKNGTNGKKRNPYFRIKLICLILGAVGIANMWLAVFADVGVMIIAVLNAVRAMFTK